MGRGCATSGGNSLEIEGVLGLSRLVGGGGEAVEESADGCEGKGEGGSEVPERTAGHLPTA